MPDNKEKPVENKEQSKPSEKQTDVDKLSESDIERISGGASYTKPDSD